MNPTVDKADDADSVRVAVLSSKERTTKPPGYIDADEGGICTRLSAAGI